MKSNNKITDLKMYKQIKNSEQVTIVKPIVKLTPEQMKSTSEKKKKEE